MAKPIKNGEKSEIYQESCGGKFKKGNPGGGRPKDSFSLLTILKNKLQEMSPDGKRNAAEVLIENIVQDALDHDDKMREIILNYVEGKPRQSIEISEIDGINSNQENIYDEE